MARLVSIHWVLIAAGWYFVNGLLHDIFVWRAHKGGYDRELLRLLMDGHMLMLSGAVLFVCYQLLQKGVQGVAMICLIVALFMILYCAMIFPFLRSFVTLLISAVLVFVSVKALYGAGGAVSQAIK
jgi:hypothetical protein